jgi:single-strand DNA-binding protein
MNDANFVLVEGNITKDPVTRNTPDDTLICTFFVAVNRFYKKGEEHKQETSFVEIEAWARLAENCTAWAHKGRGCRVTGRLKQDKWGTPENPRSKLIVIAEKIEYEPERRKGDEQ